jgi:hypothetical protein
MTKTYNLGTRKTFQLKHLVNETTQKGLLCGKSLANVSEAVSHAVWFTML